MTEQTTAWSTADTETASDYYQKRAHALVMAGAAVAVADGRVLAVEREELVNFTTAPRSGRSRDYHQSFIAAQGLVYSTTSDSYRTPCRCCGLTHSSKRVERAKVDPSDLGQAASGPAAHSCADLRTCSVPSSNSPGVTKKNDLA
jgi:hypothetical protein